MLTNQIFRLSNLCLLIPYKYTHPYSQAEVIAWLLNFIGGWNQLWTAEINTWWCST